jgi:ATP-binding cassette subfamily C protein LapB
MIEILKRLTSRPILFSEMLFASLFGNLLALVSPIFVILVLNRYIAHGVDTTLATLTIGTVIAIILEYIFRRVRYRFAEVINKNVDRQQDINSFFISKNSKALSFSQIPSETIRDIITSTESVRQVYSPSNICLLLDVPFAILFLSTLYFLNPILCYITFIFVAAVSMAVLTGILSLRVPIQKMRQASGLRVQVIDALVSSPDTIRMFDRSNFLETRWLAATDSLRTLSRFIGDRQYRIQSAIRSASALLTVLIISVGALLVVDGKLDVGTMIGANILAARALMPIVGLSQQVDIWVRAGQARRSLANFAQIPLERKSGTAINNYSGNIEVKNMTFTYPNMGSTLIDEINFSVSAGEVLCISGRNGSGKTTLAKLLAGLLDPGRGQILAGGIDLQQIAPDWWRQAIMYLPQEPHFMNGSIRENFNAFNPDLTTPEIRKLLVDVGLEFLADESPGGLDQPVGKSGFNFSLGVRRRLALARALSHDGPLVILDEPTEGIDAIGASYVYKIMNEMVRNKKTIIACSHDRDIIRGAHLFLDLDEGPRPIIKDINKDENA